MQREFPEVRKALLGVCVSGLHGHGQRILRAPAYAARIRVAAPSDQVHELVVAEAVNEAARRPETNARPAEAILNDRFAPPHFVFHLRPGHAFALKRGMVAQQRVRGRVRRDLEARIAEHLLVRTA